MNRNGALIAWCRKCMVCTQCTLFHSFLTPPLSLRLRRPQTWATGSASCCHRRGTRRTPRSWRTTTSTPRGSPPSSLLPRLPISEILVTFQQAAVPLLCVGTLFKPGFCVCVFFVCLSSLMQRRYSEPNTYIDTPPAISNNSEELYDDVASIADPEVCSDFCFFYLRNPTERNVFNILRVKKTCRSTIHQITKQTIWFYWYIN